MNELPFMLPVGLLTSDGHLHRQGLMRPATALDEIEPLGDPRVQRNEAYYPLLLLARVTTRLGPFAPVTPDILAALPAADFAHLQQLYAHLNSGHAPAAFTPPTHAPAAPLPAALPDTFLPDTVETECPHCGAVLELDLSADLAGA
ncbi:MULTISPECIES: hypothetical protein [Deinococcus]|uniref:Phage tail assembly protein n=1 Tax=Deinococcus daejeonensis TaxID=1007098 RepID=A0ABQ2J803_9DEIO|nr:MULTISPECIES: hypothetical protein [Deinococcus]RIY01125.1 hypothetical protein D3W47_16205 [Deinococcus sp. RM]GGN41173.1 hypothetical protein GCM10010842_26700 [Deinococcus daejeonensis]